MSAVNSYRFAEMSERRLTAEAHIYIQLARARIQDASFLLRQSVFNPKNCRSLLQQAKNDLTLVQYCLSPSNKAQHSKACLDLENCRKQLDRLTPSYAIPHASFSQTIRRKFGKPHSPLFIFLQNLPSDLITDIASRLDFGTVLSLRASGRLFRDSASPIKLPATIWLCDFTVRTQDLTQHPLSIEELFKTARRCIPDKKTKPNAFVFGNRLAQRLVLRTKDTYQPARFIPPGGF